ncbi:MAG: hypothetical protein R2730_14340 [Chitinophagales bacterium]
MDNTQRTKYRTKAKDSFKTKRNLFLFDLVLNGKDEFSKEEFEQFMIKEDLAKCYTTRYWQQESDKPINDIKIGDIYNRIKQIEGKCSDVLKELEYEYIQSFSKVITEEKFIELISKESCHYCGITEKKIDILSGKQRLYKKNLRGWNLEVDRLNSNFEYVFENCVMACYWCINAKTDEFTEDEFKLIGKTIGEIWERRLDD